MKKILLITTVVLFLPASIAGAEKASFTFSTTSSSVKYECSLNGSAYISCSSPILYSLINGNNTVLIRERIRVTESPIASFTFYPQNPEAGEKVTFNASSSTCTFPPCTYIWSDDGGAARPEKVLWPLGSGNPFVFTFTEPGTIYARLVIKNSIGQEGTIEHTFVVKPAKAEELPKEEEIRLEEPPKEELPKEEEHKSSECTVVTSNISQAVSDLVSGSVVCLAEGSYTAPTIENKNTSTAILQSVPGNKVSLNGTTYIFGNHITLANMNTQGIVIGNYDQEPGRNNPNAIELYNIKGLNFEIDSATNVKVEGGLYGPDSACGGPYGGGNNSIRQPEITPENIVIDHTIIHDVQSYNLVNCHIEGLAIFAGNGVTVSNSKFYGNSVYDIFTQANSGGKPNNIVIKDNWLARAEDNSGVNGKPIGTANGIALGNEIYSNVTIQGNRFNDVLNMNDIGGGNKFTNTKVINNIGMMAYNNYPCNSELPGVVWEKNVWQNDKCGSTDNDLNGSAMPYINASNNSELNYTPTGLYAGWPE